MQESGPRYSAFRIPPEAVEPIADAASETGVEVYHAEFGGRTLRIQVETSSGASVRTCSEFSRALTARLDAASFMHRQYTLEVSTPGIERKLYQPQDFTKALHQNIKALVRDGWVEGRLEAAGSSGVMIRTESGPEPLTREYAYAEIREARIRVSDSELFARSRAERK